MAIKDSLNKVKGLSYNSILSRIADNKRKKRELEEKERREQLSLIAYKDELLTIYFRETKEEIDAKLKNLGDSLSKANNQKDNNFEFRFNWEFSQYFSYSKGYGDDEERLDYFSLTLESHFASTYKDYYVGDTKRNYDWIIGHFEDMYGETKHIYPDLSSYSVGYGDRFTVARWEIGGTSIHVEMYEDRAYDSYETKYIVCATLFNNDKNLKRPNNE